MMMKTLTAIMALGLFSAFSAAWAIETDSVPVTKFKLNSTKRLKVRRSESPQVQRAKSKINILRAEIEGIEQSMTMIEETQKAIAVEAAKAEKDFRSRFEKVLLPLLHWPQIPLAERVPSWVEREHLKAVLASLRSRLTKEPLQLIADRELETKQTTELKDSKTSSLKTLESRHGILLLQLEELLSMEKKEKTKRESLLRSSGEKVKSFQKEGQQQQQQKKRNPVETEGLGPL